MSPRSIILTKTRRWHTQRHRLVNSCSCESADVASITCVNCAHLHTRQVCKEAWWWLAQPNQIEFLLAQTSRQDISLSGSSLGAIARTQGRYGPFLHHSQSAPLASSVLKLAVVPSIWHRRRGSPNLVASLRPYTSFLTGRRR